jgi:uncharacterized membrane protein
MQLARLLRHLCTPRLRARGLFPESTLDAIESAIRESERDHAGQIRFCVEHALELPALWRGESARDRALEVFSLLRVWDTEANNGVLIYLLFADRDVEIVADRGIHLRAPEAWEPICQAMERAFRAGDFQSGVIAGVRAIGEVLGRHFPRRATGTADELPNRPVLL